MAPRVEDACLLQSLTKKILPAFEICAASRVEKNPHSTWKLQGQNALYPESPAASGKHQVGEHKRVADELQAAFAAERHIDEF